MAGRFTRFLRLERPRKPGEQRSPVAHAERFAPEEARAPLSGIETDEETTGEQPFQRCARCELDNTRFAERCVNCGAALRTPEQELYNRQLWQKRRAEAAAEQEALQRMRDPGPPLEEELARERMRAQDPRYRLGEVLAQEVGAREEERLLWMSGASGVPFGVRALMAMSSRWRWRSVGALALWLGGTGLAAFRAHSDAAAWLFFGSVAVLLALFVPSRPRRRFWWSRGWW